ncbi:sensor histidine kinase [Ornithinimicrobium pekingense]|uniref:Sensor-like histidine kinase SenX3 n=1 Tax=Ornithinimicrobium pekingense TaxID=384677 RepID=A0ABQ2FCD2_9MICO|nr:ATP-binding protein [Ornithinimicrobium pekingense]GGK78335.1 sensor histidine kinase [Ornithinimicrobium pekingense]
MRVGGSTFDAATAEADRAIERYGLLTGPVDQELQALSDLAARVFSTPHAAINILTTTQQHQVATTGFEPAVCARDDSMCAVVAAVPEAVVVPDARLDDRFAGNPFVTGELGVRFYASAPLVTPDGVALGRLCVFDVEPRKSTDEQRDALTFLAARVTDVLELRLRGQQLEESLLELTYARDELARSNEALWHFATQVSHDLRNPLMAVRANAEMLAQEPAVAQDPDLVAVVDRITEAARGMGRMIQDVLAHAKEGGGRPGRGWVDLEEVVDRALLDLSPLIKDTRATIEVADLPTVPGDAELLYSVVLNILGNALKYTSPGVAPAVTMTARREGRCWRVTVSDNGIGVPPGQEHSVFLPYVRAHEGQGQPPREGYGIGLATVHRVVTAHAGRVGMQRRPGGGSDVWFELPAEPSYVAEGCD